MFLMMNFNTLGSESIYTGSDKSSHCYGFIVPLPTSDEISKEPEIQYTVMNLINDLLRMNISVYWSFSKLTLQSMEINEDVEPEMRVFEKGTFVVPFTGNINIDSGITVIIYDYNNTHELINKSIPTVETFLLMQELSIHSLYKLTEPKIAYFFGEGVTLEALKWYVSPLSQAGFLNNEFLNEDNIITSLNNGNFNTMMWTGGSFISHVLSGLSLIKRYLYQSEIKQFVRNGGGYVGTCFGAYVTSSGMRYMPFNLILYKFPILPSIIFMKMQDFLISQGLFADINVTIQDSYHPATVGVNKILHGSQIRFGGTFSNLGENIKTLGTVKSVNMTKINRFSSIFSIFGLLYKLWTSSIIGKTIWTTSEYGKGKIVTFGDHPELGDIQMKRVIHNSMLYVSSKITKDNNFQEAYPLNIIKKQGFESMNLQIDGMTSDIFNDLYERIGNVISQFYEMSDIYQDIAVTIDNLVEDNQMSKNFRSWIERRGLDYFYKVILRSLSALDDPNINDDTVNYLKQLDSISQMLLLKNISLIDQLKNLNSYNKEKIDKIYFNNINYLEILNTINSEIKNYQNTSSQNDYILKLIRNLEIDLINTDIYATKINFDSLKQLRDAWYLYETIEVNDNLIQN